MYHELPIILQESRSVTVFNISAHTYPGVKNHLSWSPGQVEFQVGQAYIFTIYAYISSRQVKNSVQNYFSLRTSYLLTGQVKLLMNLPGGQVKILRFFYP